MPGDGQGASGVNHPPAMENDTNKPWYSYLSEDIPRTVKESTDSAVRSARTLQDNSSVHLYSLGGLIPEIRSKFQTYEDTAFKNVKGALMCAKEHPATVAGVGLTAGFILIRGPKRLFLRQLGRFQSEERKFVRADKNVKELSLSVDLMKKESQKLLERAALAEKEMKNGRTELLNSGKHMHGVSKSVRQVETQALELMDLLREIPGREALKLRAQVAALASVLKQQRSGLDKRMNRISELGIKI